MPNPFTSGPHRRWFHLAAWTGFMLYSMIIINPKKNAIVWILSRVADWLGLPAYLPTKFFHLFSFGVWAALLHAALAGGFLQPLRPRSAKLLFYPLLLAYLCVPEALQLLNPVRSPSLSDVAINTSGALLALMLLILARPREAELPA